MNKENIVTLKSPYRDDFQINVYRFGKGEKTCCIVGAMRGNEVQQLYVCSQIIRALSNIEKKGDLVYGKQIMVIPSLNPFFDEYPAPFLVCRIIPISTECSPVTHTERPHRE